MDFDPLQLTN